MWRKNRGLSQAALARKIGPSAAAVAQWELGATSPTQDNLEALVGALGLTMAEFYGDPAEMSA